MEPEGFFLEKKEREREKKEAGFQISLNIVLMT